MRNKLANTFINYLCGASRDVSSDTDVLSITLKGGSNKMEKRLTSTTDYHTTVFRF